MPVKTCKCPDADVGSAFLRRPGAEHFGGRVATLQDPDGNLVQLLEQPRA